MISDMIGLAGLPFTVNRVTETPLGTFVSTSSETIADVLERLRKDYNFESYFKGTELRVGSFYYLESDVIKLKPPVFQFQRNIISDDLSYRRLDDITLSAIAHNVIETGTGVQTKDGHEKKVRKRLEVLVTLDATGIRQYVKSGRHESYPPNTEGDRRELYYGGATTIDQLVTLAAAKLKQYYYAGLRGKFTTFGLPKISQGANIEIRDIVLPERSGIFKVKSVETTGGVAGLRQIIELDYRIG